MSNIGGSSDKLGSSSGSQQTKGDGNKNKRKLADSPPQDPINLTQHESASDKASSSTQLKSAVKDPPSSQWNDPLVHQLQGILTYRIHTIFNTAIQQLVDCGYTEPVAEKALTRFGFYRGGKDIAAHIVNDALALLKNGKKVECMNDVEFDNLMETVEYTMVEMILVLLQVKPSLSIGEAMWWFLVFDLDIVQACGVKGDLMAELNGPLKNPSGPSIPPTGAQSSSSQTITFGNFSAKVNDLKNSTAHVKERGLSIAEGSSGKTPSDQQPKSVASILEETLASKGRKSLNRKELETLQKVFGNQISLSGDKTNVGDVAAVEKKNKTPSKSLGVQKRGSTSKSKGKMEAPTCGHVPAGKASAAASTQVNVPSSKPEASSSKLPNLSDYCVGIPFDKSSGRYVPQNSKDEMVLNLVSRVDKLQNEMQSWIDWANQKVMEATTRLSKDKNELKALRQEKEEAERIEKEKQTFAENAMKRLSELQCAMVNANCQVEVANESVAKLKEEQTVLWTGMEIAKLHAVESAMNYEEALEKEQKTLKEVQSWNGKKRELQEELKTRKQEIVELQQELSKAEKVQNQIQAKLKEETAEKEELLKEVASLKYEQEQLEDALIAEDEMIKRNAENDMKKYEELIQVLDKEVSLLKLKSEGSRIADLKRGMDGNYGVIESQNTKNFPETIGGKCVKRERECVMCLSEEALMLFLPCAHEVLCIGCNEIHEKQGMKDCPSCRTPIMRRISARFYYQ